MQAGVSELTDVSDQSQSVLERYGLQVRERGTYAYNYLMARRLVERGARYVQLMHAGWDQHYSITTELYTQCRDTDQPSAALVIWGGEFGRTPFIQGDLGDRPKRSDCPKPCGCQNRCQRRFHHYVCHFRTRLTDVLRYWDDRFPVPRAGKRTVLWNLPKRLWTIVWYR